MRLFLLQIFAFAYRNFLFAKRNVFMVVEMVFWPVIGVLSVGLMGGFLELGANTLSFVLIGALASGVLQITQLDVGYSVLYDLWSKSVKHTFLTPIRLTSALVGAWMVGMIRGGVVFALLVFLAQWFFQFQLPGFLPSLNFLAGIFWMSLIAGILVWILILNYGQRAEISVWALTYLLMIFCGIYYPVSLLPEPFFTLARFLPLTYFLDEARSYYGFSLVFPHGLWFGWILNFVYTFFGIFFASLAIQRAYRTGLLVRLSE
jgi:ABC-2 type transport system permease protein